MKEGDFVMGKVLDFMKYKGGISMNATPLKKLSLRKLQSLVGEGIPVDPLLIAEKLGIKVMEAKFKYDNISGLIQRKSGRVTIYIREADNAFRKRFTVAHELGHLVLHMDDEEDENFVDSDAIFARNSDFGFYDATDRQKEKEANAFAAELLMPEQKVKEHFEECFYSPELMSAKFQVSTQAMEIRLRNLRML